MTSLKSFENQMHETKINFTTFITEKYRVLASTNRQCLNGERDNNLNRIENNEIDIYFFIFSFYSKEIDHLPRNAADIFSISRL